MAKMAKMAKMETEKISVPNPTFRTHNRSPAIPLYQDVWFGKWTVPIPIPTYASVYWSDTRYTWGHVLADVLYEGNVWDISLNDAGTERRLVQRDTDGNVTWDTTQRVVSGTERNTNTDTGVPVTYRELVVDEFESDGSYIARVTFSDEPPNVCAEWMREINEMFAPLW